jgi:multiple sugar transport system substrate-binding protein
MIKKWFRACVTSVIVMGLVAGCSGGTEPGDTAASSPAVNKPKSTEPVTLTMYAMQTGQDERAVKALAKKFPHISFNVIPYKNPDQDKVFREFLTTGTVPDVILTNFDSVRVLVDLQIAMDLTGLIKENKVDLNKFSPEAIEAMKLYGDGQAILALPYFLNLNALLYNKDIFDKFGVPYPKDGLTWKQVTDLAKSVTRLVDGVQYTGFHPSRPYTISSQLGAEFIDSKATKSTVTTDAWKQVFDVMKGIYSIEGNLPKDTSLLWDSYKAFLADQKLAMGVIFWNGFVSRMDELQKKNAGFNWDMATPPVFDSAPKLAPYLDQFVWSVSAKSKHKDVAFDVINYLTSEEMQLELSKDGYIPTINNEKAIAGLGANYSWMKGKNLQAMFKLQQTKPMLPTKFNAKALMNTSYSDVLYKNVDINTALRQLEEKMNKAIEDSNK